MTPPPGDGAARGGRRRAKFRDRKFRDRQRGSALVLVLGGLALATALALAILAHTRGAVQRSRGAVEAAMAGHVAESLMHRVGVALADAAARHRLPLDGTPVEGQFLGAAVSFRIRDERGKVDLNHAPPAVLARLLAVAGAAPGAIPGIVDAWLDWRDGDDARRLHGAEAEDYRRLGLPQRPPNAPMAVIEEFRQLRGVSADLFESLKDDLTVHAGAGVVDPWSASAPVLFAATAAAPDDIARFLDDRSTAFHPAPPPAIAAGLIGHSDELAFRIAAAVQTPSGSAVRREAVLALNRAGNRAGPPPFVFLDWR